MRTNRTHYFGPRPSEVVRERIMEAFKLLRRAGFVAKFNAACCSGCSACLIAEQVGAKGRWISGAVFTHKQDMERDRCAAIDFDPTRLVFLKYGPVTVCGTEHPGTYGFDAVTVGRAVVEAVEQAGLEAVWNGNPSECVGVRLPAKG